MSVTALLDEISRTRPLTESEAARLYNGLYPSRRTLLPGTGATIVKRVASEHGVTVDQLLGRSNLRYIVHARQQVMAELRDLGWPWLKIGRFLRRDHATCIHGARQHRERVGG